MKLKYTRQYWSGTYYAKTDTHTYGIDKLPYGGPVRWQLRIWLKATDTAPSQMVKCDDSLRTFAAAKDAAQAFADTQKDN